MNKQVLLNKNLLVQALDKPASEFTIPDIVRYVSEHDIQMINFMYPAADGRLKTLNFMVNSLEYLETILTLGERVDGSSLFTDIQASSSDLYVLPRLDTAFVDPFATEIPTVAFLCSYYDRDAKPLASSPRRILEKACEEFTAVTGLDFQAMGELEYYVIAPEEESFPATDQRGYHESAPFAKLNEFRTRCMQYVAQAGGQMKYGHSEVGNFTLDGMNYEQNELEFLPVPALHAADQLMLAKWIIRNLAWEYGYDVTFAPKITAGKAGSGLHIHMRMVDPQGHNHMLDKDRRLSDEARKAIAGLMTLAPAITAFGNTNPISYLRLVPHQEAPTSVCWGDSNRSALVRVPLGWTAWKDEDVELHIDPTQKQTVEIRSADLTADPYTLMAACAVACRYGFELENALDIAERTYVKANIHDASQASLLASLASLPTSCSTSADALQAVRDVFESRGVFAPAFIDAQIARLKGYPKAEECLRDAPQDEVLRAVRKYFYCG